MQTLEVAANFDSDGHLTLLKPLKNRSGQRVRVLILISEEDEISDEKWLKAVATNPVFDFLNEEAEDIYSLEDGQPFPVR